MSESIGFTDYGDGHDWMAIQPGQDGELPPIEGIPGTERIRPKIRLTDGRYIDREVFESDLDGFRRFLSAQGRSPETIDRKVKYVRHCEKVLGGDADPRDSDDGTVGFLTDAMAGISELTRGRYLNAWNQFVRSVASDGRCEDGRLPYITTERFCGDCDLFRAWLVDGGMTPMAADKHIRFVGHCWRLMTEHVGNLYPEDVDADTVYRLDALMLDLSYGERKINLRTLGRFVHVVTGNDDPYRELTEPSRLADVMDYIPTLIRGCPYEDQLQMYANSRISNVKPITVLNKVSHIKMALLKLDECGWRSKLSDLKPEDMRYLRDQFEGVKESTVRTYMNALGEFLEFQTGRNPVRVAGIKWNGASPRYARRTFIFMDDWFRLAEAAEADEYLVLCLGASMGLRRSEIAYLSLSDIKGDFLTVHGKGHGTDGNRVDIEMTDAVRQAISEYMPMRQTILDRYGDRSEGRLLVRRFAHPGEPVPPETVADMVRRLGKRVGVDVSTHSLRRLYAMTMKDDDVDLYEIKTMMRHADLSTTLNCYIEADPRVKKAIVKGIDRKFCRR